MKLNCGNIVQHLDRQIDAAVGAALGYSFRKTKARRKVDETLDRLEMLRRTRSALLRNCAVRSQVAEGMP